MNWKFWLSFYLFAIPWDCLFSIKINYKIKCRKFLKCFKQFTLKNQGISYSAERIHDFVCLWIHMILSYSHIITSKFLESFCPFISRTYHIYLIIEASFKSFSVQFSFFKPFLCSLLYDSESLLSLNIILENVIMGDSNASVAIIATTMHNIYAVTKLQIVVSSLNSGGLFIENIVIWNIG